MAAPEPDTPAFLCGVILAAGASTRMGQPKQLLPWRGRPLLQHVADAATSSRLDQILLVLGHHAEATRRGLDLAASGRVRVIINPEYALGLSTSLRLGLQATDPRTRAAAILLGDQPRVSARLIDTIAAAFLAAAAPMARPVYTGADGRRLAGHPVFLSRQVWPEVEKLRGDQGARSLLADHPEWVLEVPVEGEPPGDIDTWADYSSRLNS